MQGYLRRLFLIFKTYFMSTLSLVFYIVFVIIAVGWELTKIDGEIKVDHDPEELKERGDINEMVQALINMLWAWSYSILLIVGLFTQFWYIFLFIIIQGYIKDIMKKKYADNILIVERVDSFITLMLVGYLVYCIHLVY